MKIICLSHGPMVSRSVWHRYRMDILNRKCQFESWNLQSLINYAPDISKEAEYSFEKDIHTYAEFITAIDCTDLTKTLFLIGVPESFKYRKIFRILAQKKCVICRYDFCANTLPIPKTLLDGLSFLSSPKKMWHFIMRKVNALYWKFNDIHYRSVFSSSDRCEGRIPINHPDYEKFSSCIGVTKESMGLLEEKRYAVFYDSYYPLHPDFKFIHKISMNVDHEKYLRSLNSYFSRFEDKYDVQVIIAAHPRSNYPENAFGGRSIIKGKTCELTICSDYVINHSSNSTSFAALDNKPIVFITNDEMEKCRFMSRYIDTLSSVLGKQKYNIDHHEIDSIPVDKIEEKFRNSYIRSFITSQESYSKSNGDIFVDFANTLLAGD